MSEAADIIVCPADDTGLVDTMAIVIGVLTVMGSVLAYFLQQRQDRVVAAEAKLKLENDLDREQALARVRLQLSEFIGPMHRLWKTQSTIVMHYLKQSGHGFDHMPEVVARKGQAYWMTLMREDFLLEFVEDPHSFEAVNYRNVVTRRLKPMYTRIRELVLTHMSDLADMPTQEEWLSRYREEDITSPYNGSMNINVIFDTYTAWTLEFDDIVESWAEGDFRRMQPTIKFAFLICNDLIDLLYDNAKAKEARYNKHVTVHRNTIQMNTDNLGVGKESTHRGMRQRLSMRNLTNLSGHYSTT